MDDDGAGAWWIVQCEAALKLAQNANDAQRKFNNLQDLNARFTTLLTEFNDLAEGASVLRSFGWNGRLAPPDLVNDLREAIDSSGSRALNSLIRSLERFGPAVKADLVEFWRQHAAERMGDLAELQVLAATLSEVEDIAELSTRLEAALGQLARTQTDFPSRQAVELLESAEAALRQMEESLQPESVRRFLSAATRGGAALDLLTEDVTDWLYKHKASRSFKVVAGAPIDGADV